MTTMSVGEMKEIIKDCPDDMLIYVTLFNSPGVYPIANDSCGMWLNGEKVPLYIDLGVDNTGEKW